MKYHIELDPALVQLASVFDKAELTLYLSGESLRAKILGQPCSELEVSSGASPNKVTDLLRSNKSTRVLIDAQSPDTVYIMLKKSPRETLTLRHITLRKEIPDFAGSLRFSISITEDSLHRDFTINALYYVISSGQLLNPRTGFGDIAERIIRPVIQPKLFFGEEPEMILRAIRYSCGLNFSIEPSSMEAIKENIPSLAESTPEAVKRELNALLLLDKEFGSNSGQLFNALKMCLELGCFDILFPHTVINECSMSKCVQMPALLDARICGLLSSANNITFLLKKLNYDSAFIKRCQNISDAARLEGNLKDMADDLARVGLDSALRACKYFGKDSSLFSALLNAGAPANKENIALSGTDIAKRIGPSGKSISLIKTKLYKEVLFKPSLNNKDDLNALLDDMGY